VLDSTCGHTHHIWQTASHATDVTVNNYFVLYWTTAFSHVELHHHWYGNCTSVITAKFSQDHSNVPIWVNVNLLMISIVFNIYIEIADDILNTDNISTIEEISIIVHMEPPYHHIYDLPRLGMISNHQQISHTRLNQAINVPYILSGGINCLLLSGESRNPNDITQSIYMQYQICNHILTLFETLSKWSTIFCKSLILTCYISWQFGVYNHMSIVGS